MTLPQWWTHAIATSHRDAPGNLWQSLKTRLDVAKWKPARAEGIVVSELRDRAGAYYVLKNPRVHTYLRLAPREYWVWERLDGAHTVQELIVAYFQTHGSFAFGLVVGLVQQLFEKEMLSEQPEFIFSNVQRDLRQRALLAKLFHPERGWLTRQFLIARIDDLVARLYRGGAWIFFTRVALIIFCAMAAAGTLLFTQILGDARFKFTERGLGVTILFLWLAAIIPIALHELAHALATKHFKREVHRGGLMLYYGLPAAFVDTTDIWLESERPRIAVALAGPFASILVASICAIWLWLAPAAEYAPILFQIASIGFVISLINLNPALPLDGYYILSDALEIPKLRERSFAFFRHKFLPKLFQRERSRWTRDEIIFLAFGAMTAIWIGYSALLAWIAYRTRIAPGIRILSDTLAREYRVLAIGLLVLVVLTMIIFLRKNIFAMARNLAAQIRGIELLTRPVPLALAIVCVAAIVTFAPLVLIPEFVEWVDTIVGMVAVAFGFAGAARIAREMRGTFAARAWQIIALAMGLVGAAHVFWGLRFDIYDPVAIALDLATLALTFIAAIFSLPLLLGLQGSWRAATTSVLGLGWLGLLAPLALRGYFPGVALHLFPVLLLLGGVLHWQMAHPATLAASHLPTRALTTNEQMRNAFQSLAESVLEQLQVSFGKANAARAISRFNSRSRERDWGMTLADGKMDFALPGSVSAADLADLIAAALSVLLYSIARIVGENFVRPALARAYDALNWDEREVIAENVLPQTRYAEGLAEQFAQARQDVAGLLERAPLFADFTREELRAIGQELRMEYFARGDTIIHQGDAGDRFYILRRGRVQVNQRDAQGYDQVVNQLESGDYFGEAALLTGAPRNATIRALTSVSAFTLSKRSFDQLVRAGFRGRDKIDVAIKRLALLRRIPIFSDFDNFELRRVARQLESIRVEEGQVIFEQGDPGDKYYIIESGEVAVETRGANGEMIEQARLGAGEYFGEIALLMNVPRTATIVALKPSRLVALGANAFNELVRQSQSVSRALERTGSRRMLLLAQSQPSPQPSP